MGLCPLLHKWATRAGQKNYGPLHLDLLLLRFQKLLQLLIVPLKGRDLVCLLLREQYCKTFFAETDEFPGLRAVVSAALFSS